MQGAIDARADRRQAIVSGILMTTTALVAGGAADAHAQGGQGKAPTAGQTVPDARAIGFDIPAQPLGSGLTAFGRQSGLQISVDAAMIGNAGTQGVSGTMTRDQALTRLLAGTGFTHRFAAGNTVMLERLPAAADAAGGAPGVVELSPVRVRGNDVVMPPANTLNADTGIGRLPGRVQDTPQIVNVIPQEVIQQQNVTTLEQALRNVPGITVAIGEGNGGMNGDQFRIRGFEAKGDTYVDGLRDFGVYVRDSFASEQIQVLKGPSSESFGVGSTGGAINSSSKQAHLGDSHSADLTFGTGPTKRGVFDVNRQITDSAAFRVTGMVHDQDIADRDHVKSDRWGVNASLALGLGTDTNWSLTYFHQHNDRTPDYGVPMIGRTATSVRKPAPEHGVPRSNFYGKDTDTDRSNIDMVTSRFKTEATDWLTISNDTRVSYFKRDFSTTTSVCDQTCANTFFAGGNPLLSFGAGGGSSYRQESWGVQDILSAVARFNTGGLSHEAVAGVDGSYQNDDRQGLSYSPSKGPLPRLLTPNTTANYSIIENRANIKKTETENVGLFVSDRMWLTDEISVLGGLRWDYFKSRYEVWGTPNATNRSGRTTTEARTDFFSPKASLIWEPTKSQTYYLSYATAATLPFGQYATSDVTPLNASRKDLDPETTRTVELGAKLNLLDERLGLTGAAFQVVKDNTYYADPTSGVLTQTGEKQRVRGIELGVTGQVTKAWTVNAAYTYLDSEILATTVASNVGRPVQGVPENSASLWTTYELTAHIPQLPGKLLVGGGATYRDGMPIRSDGASKVPYSLSFDAMASYEYEHYRVGLNGYNLADRVNYDTFFQGENANTSRAIPSAGRTVLLTVGATF